MMIDAHAHLHDKKYDADRTEVIERAFDGGVEKIVTIGTSVAESQDAVDLAEEYDEIYATVGILASTLPVAQGFPASDNGLHRSHTLSLLWDTKP